MLMLHPVAGFAGDASAAAASDGAEGAAASAAAVAAAGDAASHAAAPVAWAGSSELWTGHQPPCPPPAPICPCSCGDIPEDMFGWETVTEVTI